MRNKGDSSLSSLLSSIRRRTILRSPTQFLAVIFIVALSVTLFVGLTSNAESISQRVNELYEGSNMADLWITVTSEDENDYDEISKIVGDKGAVEERFSISASINSRNGTALLSHELPTINKPYSTDNEVTEDFFIVDEKLITSSTENSANWYDADGNYGTITVDFSFATYRDVITSLSLYDFLENELGNDFLDQSNIYPLPDLFTSFLQEHTVMEVLDLCVAEGKENIFDSAYLDLNLKVTGSMTSAENVQSSLVSDTSFLLDQDYFLRVLDDEIKETFVLDSEMTDALSDNFIDFLERYFPTIVINETLSSIINETFDSFLETIFTYISDVFTTNQYVITVDDDTLVDDIQNEISNYYHGKETSNLLIIQTRDTLTSNVTIQSDITQAKQLAYLFPLIFFVVSILVVLTTLSQLILKDRTNIGTMKALGIPSSKIIWHYIILSLIVVGVGLVIGIILGPIVLPLIMNQKYAILYTLPALGYVIAIPETIISAIVVLLLTAFVTFLIVRKSVKLKPAESMRPPSPRSPKRALLNNVSRKEKPAQLSMKMAFRNISVHFSRSIMVVIGVLGCTALLVCGFGIDDTIDNSVLHDTYAFYNADIMCTYSSTSSRLDTISAIEGVDVVEEYSSLPATVIIENTSYSTIAFTIEDDSNFFTFDDGYELKDKIIVSNKVATNLDLEVGDTLSFTVLGNTYSGEIGFINDAFYLNGIYLNASYSNFSELFAYRSGAYINLVDDTNLESVYSELQSLDGISSISSFEEMKDTINGYVDSISLMTLAVKVFAILLAIIVLYNLALLNFKERLRDIATLKVLGFSKTEIGLSLGAEIMILTIVGIAFGLLLGNPLQILILYVNQTPLVDFLYATYFSTYGLAFLITFFTAFIVTLYLAFKTRTVKMVESLKSIE